MTRPLSYVGMYQSGIKKRRNGLCKMTTIILHNNGYIGGKDFSKRQKNLGGKKNNGEKT
jgi:hypothetical protein